MTQKITILFGGRSEERLVSVASAQNLAGHLPDARLYFWSPSGELHEVSPAELARHQNPFTTQFVAQSKSFAGSLEAAIDLLKGHTVILALHGTEGEDGSVQALFEKNQIAFTGTGARASQLAFDKKLTKELGRKNHLPITDDLLLTDPTHVDQKKLLESFFQTHQHIVLKPVANGSSVGLFIIHNQAELTKAMNAIKAESGAYLAERFITGREITVGVMDQLNGELKALPCSEVQVVQGRQFDYEGKYLGQGVVELTPAPITHEQTQACQQLALSLHRLAGCFGYSRTDMILTERGPVLLEINTLPGLSRASFIPQQLTAMGMTLKEFFAVQITLAEKRNQNR